MTTANFIPSLCPNSKHLTKFDAIYNQKSPTKTMTFEKADQISNRLYSSNHDDEEKIKRRQQVMKKFKESKVEDHQRKCTFQPDTSLSSDRNQFLYDKMKSRSRSRDRRPMHIERNTSDSNLLMLKGIELNNFNTITEESDNVNARNITCKNNFNRNAFGSLKSSTSQSLLLSYKNRQPSPKRTFKEFYAQQMMHVKNKTDKVQTGLYKRDRIFEEMKKQRERVKHLSEKSRKILSRSRSREKSRDRFKLLDASLNSKEMSSMMMKTYQDFSFKSLHERLHNEQKSKNQNKSMMQFKEHLKIKKMVKYGARSRSSKRKTMGNSTLTQSQSLMQLSRPISNLKTRLNTSGNNRSKSSRSPSQRKNAPEADLISQKLYQDAMKRIKNK
jgi:hypothetical protein